MADENKGDKEKIESLLRASELAKHKLLADLVSRIAAGEVLKATEYGILTKLESELIPNLDA